MNPVNPAAAIAIERRRRGHSGSGHIREAFLHLGFDLQVSFCLDMDTARPRLYFMNLKDA